MPANAATANYFTARSAFLSLSLFFSPPLSCSASLSLSASVSASAVQEMIKAAQALEWYQGSKEDEDYVMSKGAYGGSALTAFHGLCALTDAARVCALCVLSLRSFSTQPCST